LLFWEGEAMFAARAILIAVVGPVDADAGALAHAETVGGLLAGRGCTLLTGGRGGVMLAASRGAAQAGGLTIGILPGTDPAEANEFVQLPLATGLGEARNAVIVRAADAVIAVGKGLGTLSEVALARKFGKPVISLCSWQDVAPAIRQADTPEQAVDLALRALNL